jgi:hypothetical protein
MALAGFLSTAASCLYVNKVARLTILPQKKKGSISDWDL